MLKVSNLQFRYDNNVVLEDISFEVAESHIYGLVGENGSGKTTLFNCLSSYYYPNSGEITYNDAFIENNASYLKDTILLSEDYYVSMYSIEKLAKKMAILYDKKYDPKSLEDILKPFALKKDGILKRMSKGQQKIAFICIALSLNPKRLFLDEFLDGIDIVNRRLVKDLLLDYIVYNEAIIIIASHTTDDIKDICDQLILIKDKKIKYQTDFDDLKMMYTTYQIVSDTPLTKEALLALGLDVRGFKSLGNIYWISVKIDDDVNKKMAEIQVKDIRKIKASLEEVIYYEFTA